MGARLRLDDLSPAAPAHGGLAGAAPAAAIEDAKLSGYEQGYAAGWDDAIAAQDAETLRLKAGLVRSLEDLSFSYHEARTAILASIEPLLTDMVSKVLPALAHRMIGPVVAEHLGPAMQSLSSPAVELVVSPASRPLVEPLLPQDRPMSVDLREDPDLTDGQAHLRFGGREVHIDLDAVVEAIARAVADLHLSRPDERKAIA
jgi:flagellar assembly protein FliH